MREQIRAICAALIAVCSVLSSSSASAEIRALLVGATTYEAAGIPDLEGPKNDVAEVEKLIRRQGASDITVLKDEKVSRSNIEAALHDLGLRSHPGDWLIFMYAGHGAQAEAAIKGEKKDDLDDFLVLPHLNIGAPDPENYVTSADLRAWLLNYVPSGVTVLQMVDACHSGTLQRKIDPRALRFTPRLAFRARGGPDAFKLPIRPAPKFSSVPGSIGASLGVDRPEYLPNVLYVSAAQDDQFAQEAPLPEAGSPSHGVLTYNFLAALTATADDGKTLLADSNRDGVISMGELAVYLNTQTRVMTEQEQEPSIHFASRFQDEPLFARSSEPLGAAVPNTFKPAIYAEGEQALAVLNSDQSWAVAPTRAKADFIWDMPSGDLIRNNGDVVARKVFSAPALEGVTEKWATVEALRPYLVDRLARVEIGPDRNGVRYPQGAHVEVQVSAFGASAAPPPAKASRFVTVFNLASDGLVQSLYPEADDGAGEMAGQSLPVLTTEVVEPYGTDHVFALLTPDRPDEFRALLRTVNGSRQSGRLVTALKRELAKGGAGAALSVGELFTGPSGQ